MEEEEVHITQTLAPASSPTQSRASDDRGLVLSLVPKPSTLSPSSPSLSPPGSAVFSLQSKVNNLSQRTGGKERERVSEDNMASELQVEGPVSFQDLPKQKGRSRGEVPPPVPFRHFDQRRRSSSSEDEIEEEVVARVQLHTDPTEPQREKESWGAMGKGAEKGERGGPAGSVPGQPRGLGEGASLESLENIQSDSTGATKEDPPPSSKPAPASSSTSSSSCHRHWAPPKGFWRVARPETLILNRVSTQSTVGTQTTMPILSSFVRLKDEPPANATFSGPQSKSRLASVESVDEDRDESEGCWNMLRSDSLDCYLERCEKKEAKEPMDPVGGLWRAESWESVCSQEGTLSLGDTVEANQRARGRSVNRRRNAKRGEEKGGVDIPYLCVDQIDKRDVSLDASASWNNEWDLTIPQQELLELPGSHFNPEELPLSPRHEQAMLLLERARLKARFNHAKGERPQTRRSHSAQRYNPSQQSGSDSALVQKAVAVKPKEELTAPPSSGPLLVPQSRDLSPGGHNRRYGNSPTRVRFEDESEKEAESRYLDRMRERGRAKGQKSKGTLEKKAESSISITGLTPRLEDVGFTNAASTQVTEVLVVLRKCEACGSILRDPPVPEPETAPPQSCNAEENQGRKVSRWGPPAQSDGIPQPDQPSSIHPKAAGVTFGEVLILGEDKEGGAGGGVGERSSGFGKLRRRSKKGETRLKRVGSGHGPYGASWAHRRNSNPRNRVNVCRRAVSFALGSPVALDRPLVGASGNSSPKDSDAPTPPLPIKSALKSGCKSRASGQHVVKLLPSVQYRLINLDEGAGGTPQHDLINTEQHGEGPISAPSGSPPSAALLPCIRPSSLRYSPARITPDLPPAELGDTAADGAGLALSGDVCRDLPVALPECRPALRCLGVSRAEDLRAELLRAEHLKAEAQWEDGQEGARRDGRPKLSLRRFFSSIGLHSVGRLVKGGRSSSMEQLSISAPRASSASPSPTHSPHTNTNTRLQRTPSLQTLHTVSPLAQLRKASSVQSLERRVERSTILGEVSVPNSLAPRMIQRALSVEDVLAPRVVRPVGRVVQAFPDGTLWLELTRPPNGPFGFVISRGKGRPVTGVYVEQVGDGTEEGLYSGLLGVGDEILEVNGETVAGLTLDLVTRLMTRDSTASIRVLPHRRNYR
uniref:Si:ch211-13f8.1 n=1 Tax=Hucho hucho TaxID=62062 RepID=A0A4W5LBH5_9TELE